MADGEKMTDTQNSHQNEDCEEQMDVDQETTQQDKYGRSYIARIYHSVIYFNREIFVMSSFDFSLAMADAKKAEGNKEYGQKHYEAALRLYTEAIGKIMVLFKSGLN